MASVTQKELIKIRAEQLCIEGMLELPPDPIGVILFAHGSGSSRFSPRNNYVASELRHAQMGTLLLDLLSPHEEQHVRSRFDISLLTQRLGMAVDWLRQYDNTRLLPIGLFGASTGAAAALQVAAIFENDITAIVSRGGRPDLAGSEVLQKVKIPTLLLVGGLDQVVIELNQVAYALLPCKKQLEIVPGASHLFEEPGKLEAVATLATNWFVQYLNNRQI